MLRDVETYGQKSQVEEYVSLFASIDGRTVYHVDFGCNISLADNGRIPLVRLRRVGDRPASRRPAAYTERSMFSDLQADEDIGAFFGTL